MPTGKEPKPKVKQRSAERKSPAAGLPAKEPGIKVMETVSGQKNAASRPPSRQVEKYHQRIGTLFADLDSLANDQSITTPEVRSRIEALYARLRELEAQPSDGPQMPAATVEAEQPKRSNVPILYERDQVGYIYSHEQLHEIRSAENLADLAPTVGATLITSGQPIGEIGLAIPPERLVTPEETGIVHSVAQQVSLQIQSLRLLAEAERARTEAEASTRRFMHESWDSYLDAIHQNEQIGYSYDQSSVEPFHGQPENEDALKEVVSVLNEQVGALYLKPDPSRPVLENDKEMISAVASQIAQQVENIRLLADASRARAEADEVIRRVTRESWETFVAGREAKSLGFVYDANRVKEYEDDLPKDAALMLPLQVRGETIGQLTVAGAVQISPEASEMASAIAEQVSMHLETLRLNEELQQRAAELLELDRMKSSFLANMSHELRTPLNSILGFADVILTGLDGPLTENMDSDLKLVQKNGQHLLNLINDVLDMAKIEAGRMSLSLEQFVLDELLEEVVSITSTLASEKNLSLFVEADSDKALIVIADRTRLRQVVINLVNNAIKFTEKGKIAVRVDLLGNDKLSLRVKDTGIGIPPDKLEVIFQEFAQVDTSTTRKAGGTGLGLPISRRLVEMHGGRLWAESSGVSGEGSTFYVELPLEAKPTEPVEITGK